jgi:tripartite-type tricarboxylate transporter receptor subunit TctC
VLAPADTPRDIVVKLNATSNAILAMPDVKERIAGVGADPQGGTPEQFRERLVKELDTWPRVLKKK